MSLPLKVAATAGVVGGGSLVGCYFGGVFNETPWVPLKVDGESSYTDKVGKKYSIYLLAVHGNKGGEVGLNEAKWKELYKQYLADSAEGSKVQMSNEFKDKKVKSAYDSSADSASASSTALNKVCGFVYGKSESKSDDTGIDFSNPSGTNNRDKLAKNLLKYCSPLGEVPKKLSSREGVDTKYTSGMIGNDKKEELADFSGNNAFWDIKQEQFDGDKATLQSNKFFKKYIEEGQSIRKICETAYSKTKASDTATVDNPKEDEIVKYCSFKALP